jgi:hypothetical protein
VRRVPIHLKLAAGLAAPLLVLAALSAVGVVQAAHERSDVMRQAELARAAIGPAGLITTLQNERIWAPLEILKLADQFNAPVESYDQAWSQTDAAITDLRHQVTTGDATIVAAFGPPLAALDELRGVRADIRSFRSSTHHSTAETITFAFGLVDRYTALIAPFYDATTRVAAEIEDPVLHQGAQLSDDIARAIEATTILASTTVQIGLITEGGVDQQSEVVEIARLQERLHRYATRILPTEGPYAHIPNGPDAQKVISGLDDTVNQAMSSGRFSLERFFEAINMPRGEGLFGYQDGVHAILSRRADALEADARSRELRLATVALVTLALAAVLDLLVSRSITRPMRSLTRQAQDLAGHRLPEAVHGLLGAPPGPPGPPGSPSPGSPSADGPAPPVEPVDVGRGDELADVAGALNTVQSSVVELAGQQAAFRQNIADLFGNLSRRNDELLRRQMGLIDRIGAAEASAAADRRTRAGLALLDDLARQMRRNTESLLAVAGIDARRRWQAPVGVDELFRYARAQVSDDRRVVLERLERADVAGAVAADVVHLLAELIENALTFSAATTVDRPIALRGGHRHEGGGYWLAVIDLGGVMTPAEVAAINHQLTADEPTATVPSSVVDHTAAGRLARRVEATVRVDSSPGWGVTASIDLGPELLVSALATSPPASPGPEGSERSGGSEGPDAPDGSGAGHDQTSRAVSTTRRSLAI